MTIQILIYVAIAISGLLVGCGIGLGTMYFANKKGIVQKVEDKVTAIWYNKNMVLLDIQGDVKNLKNVKAKDMDDALKAIRDKIESLF